MNHEQAPPSNHDPLTADPRNPDSPPTSPAAVSEARLSSNPPLPQNGERLPSGPSFARASSRLPRARHWSNGRTLLVAGLVVLLFIGGVVGLAWMAGGIFGRTKYTGLTAPVVRERLKITIVARGSLESAKNNDIICRVKSGTKGSTNSTSIKWLVDNGAEVEEGEKIMELDDSGLKEQLKSQNITVDGAKADEIKAAEQYRIDEIQCTSDIEKAVNARDLAKLDLDKYIEGDYVQALKSAEGLIETSTSDLENWKDRSAWSQRMLKKGLMSKVQADADVSRVDGARIALDTLVESKRVLVDYTKKRTIQDLTAKLAEAERTMEKTKIQTKSSTAPRSRSTIRSLPKNRRSRRRSPSAPSRRRRPAWLCISFPSRCVAGAAASSRSSRRASLSARARR